MSCGESGRRRSALAILGAMMLIFIVLSGFSFLGPRERPVPEAVTFAGRTAVEGKRVFQAFNCMGCHTLVGNGAYLGPDLTHIYEKAGPAWIAAFLPSAGTWPTAPAIRAQLLDPAVAGETGSADLERYFAAYPAARLRVDRRGGHPSLMPNLPIGRAEVEAVIAFFKYTSMLDTEGWPPRPLAAPAGATPPGPTPAAEATAAESAPPPDPVARGRRLASDLGCVACHAPDRRRTVGPGWGALHGSEVRLVDGSRVIASDEYLRESILDPDAKVVEGYAAGVMPAYGALLTRAQADTIVAYIRSLGRP